MRPQRSLAVMTVLIALLLTVLAGSTVALPVQGNLVVTSGEVVTFRNFMGFESIFGTFAGDGFSLRLTAGLFDQVLAPLATKDLYGEVISPGRIITPFNSNLFVDHFGVATILGVDYGLPGGCDCIPVVFFSTQTEPDFLPYLSFSFTRSVQLPPVSPGGQGFAFTAPFVFAGSIGIETFGHKEPLFDLRLTGTGTATITFVPRGDGWAVDPALGGTRYVFGEVPQPTPEPATLLLWGTAGVALSVARRARRWRTFTSSRARAIRGLVLVAVSITLGLGLSASPAAAVNIGGLTRGSVSLDPIGVSGFAGGSAVDAEGNTYGFSWIPLFIQGHRGPASASSSWADSDVASSRTTYRGQTYIDCSIEFPGHPSNTPPCGQIRASVSMGAPVPPFPGGSAQIWGTFQLFMDVTLFDSGFEMTQFGFAADGPALINLQALLGADSWVFDSGVGWIGPVPEPTTLLLWGAGTAGLGLARWLRRRSHQHEYAA